MGNKYLLSSKKRILDIIGASLILILVSPVVLIIFLILLMDGFGVLYVQSRVGLGGRIFSCMKIRTMERNADKLLDELLARDEGLRRKWEQERKLDPDPRVTSFGSFLRKTSIDELPQLVNVIRGDMSLVGPRPIGEEELAYYGDNQASYLSTRPGLTGRWQASGRSDVSYERRVAMDVEYVAKATLRMDILIILKTARAVISRAGAR